MMRATTCAFAMLTLVSATLGAAITLLPSLSAVQAVALVAPLAIVVVALFYAKRDGGDAAFYWARMFAAPGAPWWRRAPYGLAARMGRVRR